MNEFKYVVSKGRGSLFTQRNLTWLERLMYRLKGYKVTKIN